MLKRFIYIPFVFMALLACVLYGCDANRIFEENKKLPDYIWSTDNKISFEVTIEDTVQAHNVYVNVRNASIYPFSNLYLFLTTRYPNGKLSRDTLECILADHTGKWLGDGSGDIWDNQILFKSNVRFPQNGTYTFEFEQAMRMKDLPGIMDVGLRIEKRK